VKRLKVPSPWHTILVCSASSDNPDIVRSPSSPCGPPFDPAVLCLQSLLADPVAHCHRPRDTTITLRPHPATADIYVCFAPVPPIASVADGDGKAASTSTSSLSAILTLRPTRDAIGGVGNGQEVVEEEVLRIVVNASWE
jgi:hypothetical protein